MKIGDCSLKLPSYASWRLANNSNTTSLYRRSTCCVQLLMCLFIADICQIVRAEGGREFSGAFLPYMVHFHKALDASDQTAEICSQNFVLTAQTDLKTPVTWYAVLTLLSVGNEYCANGGDALWLGVKAGMTRVWWQVKLCDPLYNRCHTWALYRLGWCNEALYKFTITLFYWSVAMACLMSVRK